MHKKIILIIAILASLLPSTSLAWNISTFDADIQIQKNSRLTVTETIVADFQNDPHHGIIRFIPVEYKDKLGIKKSLNFKIKEITDENGNPWNYTKTQNGQNISLKIGDAWKTLDQKTTYRITYEIQNAINPFETHDELYWNVTGTQWEIPINQTEATVTLPGTIPEKKLTATCYTGSMGSEEKNCQNTITDGSVHFTMKPERQILNTREGLTIVVGFPKGTVTFPGLLEKIIEFLRLNYLFTIPLWVFLGLWYHWNKTGKMPKTDKDTIVPTFEVPDDLSPAEIGTIYDDRIDMKDMSATIVDLAIRGELKIIENQYEEKGVLLPTFAIQKLKKTAGGVALRPFEKILMTAIFGEKESEKEKTKKLKDMENDFSPNRSNIKKTLYQSLIEKKYFSENPETKKLKYGGTGAFLLISTLFFGPWIYEIGSIALIFSTIVSAILFIIFAIFTGAKTQKGATGYFQILGLKEYINTAEKDRIHFQEKEKIFEKLLPYAMVFGISKKWSKAFEDVYQTPPDWYQTSDKTLMKNFSVSAFGNRLSQFSEKVTKTMEPPVSTSSKGSTASSGGSGFSSGSSGGGFGGGGGKGW